MSGLWNKNRIGVKKLYKKVLMLLALVITTASSEIDSALFRIEAESMRDNLISLRIAYEAGEYCDALIYARYVSSFFLKYHEAEMYVKSKSVVDEMYWCCERMN